MGFKDAVTNSVNAKLNKSFEISTVTTTTEPKEYTTTATSRVTGNTSFRLFRTGGSSGTYDISLSSISGENGFSVNYWVYMKAFNTTSSDSEYPINVYDGIASTGAYYNNSSQNHMWYYNTGVSSMGFLGATLPRNEQAWRLFTITMVMDNSFVSVKFYQNGVAFASPSWTRTTNAQINLKSNSLGINTVGKFQGYLDQLTVHNKVLTQSEITAIYTDAGNIQNL